MSFHLNILRDRTKITLDGIVNISPDRSARPPSVKDVSICFAICLAPCPLVRALWPKLNIEDLCKSHCVELHFSKLTTYTSPNFVSYELWSRSSKQLLSFPFSLAGPFYFGQHTIFASTALRLSNTTVVVDTILLFRLSSLLHHPPYFRRYLVPVYRKCSSLRVTVHASALLTVRNQYTQPRISTSSRLFRLWWIGRCKYRLNWIHSKFIV